MAPVLPTVVRPPPTCNRPAATTEYLKGWLFGTSTKRPVKSGVGTGVGFTFGFCVGDPHALKNVIMTNTSASLRISKPPDSWSRAIAE